MEAAEFRAGVCASGEYYTLPKHTLPEDERISMKPGKPLSLEKCEEGIRLKTDAGEAVYAGVFVFRPAVAPGTLLPGLELDGSAIRVDRRMATSIPRVYACGDCTGQPLQIAKAVGEGNIAAISAAADLAALKKGNA